MIVHGVGCFIVLVVAVILGWYPEPLAPHWGRRDSGAQISGS